MTLKQKVFVKALTDPRSPTYCRPSQAYRVASPTVTPESSRTGAWRMLMNVDVANVVEGELSVDDLGNILKVCISKSMAKDDLSEVRASSMDYAKLTGKIIERREITTLSDADNSAVRGMVAASMTATRNKE